MRIKTLKNLYDFILKGNTFENIDFHEYESVTCDCECIGNNVYEDENLYEFMRELNVEVDRKDSSIILSDGKTSATIECLDEPNRFDAELPDETIFFFDTIKLLKS